MGIRVKRALLASYDAISVVAVACLLSTGFPALAYAYVDPSVMTYTIQALAGVAVALSAVLGVALRRGRRLVTRILDIDPNAGRIIEPDIVRIDRAAAEQPEQVGQLESVGQVEQPEQAGKADEPEQAGKADEPEQAGEPACASELEQPQGSTSPSKNRRFRDRRPYAPTWRKRLLYGLVVSLFFVFTIFYVAPIEIVQGAASSLVYPVADLWWVPILPCLGLVAALTLVFVLLRGRAFAWALMLVFALGLCAYMQALFLNAGLPAADGATIYWADYMPMQIISSIVWVAIIIVLVLCVLHNRVRAQGIALLGSAALIAVQAVVLAIVLIFPSSPLVGGAAAAGAGTEQAQLVEFSGSFDPAAEEAQSFAQVEDVKVEPEDVLGDSKSIMTEDGLFSVSAQDNVILFVLDTFDTGYLKRIIKKDPSLLDEFTGFTNYENCTSAMIPTRFAMPFMLTGEMPSFDEDFSTYKAERYERGTFLSDMAQAGYSVGLYTDSLTIGDLPAAEQAAITGLTMNIHDLGDSAMDYWGALQSMWQMALYRDVLWPFKWAFWYYTDQVNAALVAYDEAAAPEDTVYLMDDLRFCERLRTLGLSVQDDAPAGAFRMIHLQGSHYPFIYDEEAVEVGEGNSDVFKQSRGVLKIVSEYLRQLKELGLYDSATIIVTADHGYWTITEDPIEETSTPIMFVKPAETAEQAAQPMVTDEKPVSHLDLQATILAAMGLDYSKYAQREGYEGYSMFDDIDPDRERLYLTTDSWPDLTETQFREYLISGNALDFDNWSETGRTINAFD